MTSDLRSDGRSTSVPETPAARAALEVATNFSSPALLNHCTRSYLWAKAYGASIGLAVDDELLYVAAMLHDMGLTEAFDNHTEPFEDTGAAVAWVLGAAAGWTIDRRTRVGEVIVRHMWEVVEPHADVEGHLLEYATAVDIVGRGLATLPAPYVAEVLAEHPRLGLAGEFRASFRDQASRKPRCRAAELVALGADARILSNPLDHPAS